MAKASTAKILQENLTERGLVRILARQDVAPQIVYYWSVEEAARQLQRGLRRPPPMVKKAKKSAKKTGPYKKAKPKKTSAGSGTGRAVVRQVLQPNYWARVKRELRILICTNDVKYQSIRRLLGKESRMAQTVIVSGIGASIGEHIGPAATIVAPLVTLGLLGFLQVGKEAWCSGEF